MVLYASLWEISTCRNFTISVSDSEVVSSISLSQIKWSLSNISSNKSLRSPASSHFLRKATFAIASKNKKHISVCRHLSLDCYHKSPCGHFRSCHLVDERKLYDNIYCTFGFSINCNFIISYFSSWNNEEMLWKVKL